jgi:hypothetical protein
VLAKQVLSPAHSHRSPGNNHSRFAQAPAWSSLGSPYPVTLSVPESDARFAKAHSGLLRAFGLDPAAPSGASSWLGGIVTRALAKAWSAPPRVLSWEERVPLFRSTKLVGYDADGEALRAPVGAPDELVEKLFAGEIARRQ